MTGPSLVGVIVTLPPWIVKSSAFEVVVTSEVAVNLAAIWLLSQKGLFLD